MPTRPIRARFLRRYTHLPAVLGMLRSRQLTFLSPSTWEDKNDRVFMGEYLSRKGLSTLLGVCFSQAAETFHHWKIFAPGSAGVCIEFHKQPLLDSIPKSGFRHRRVTYKKPVSLIGGYATISELPFIKGWAFRDEKEYRIIFESEREAIQSHSIPLDLSCVRSITVSPWLPRSLLEATRSAINDISGCEDIPVVSSVVIDNEHWQNYARNA